MAARKQDDEYLGNGSVIYWSRQFADGRYASGKIRWRVPVRCGMCGRVREVGVDIARKSGFTGLCRSCAYAQAKKVKDEQLESCSIVYWSRRFADGQGRRRVPVRCGRCKRVREIAASLAHSKRFTSLCHACAMSNRALEIPRSTLERLYREEGLTQSRIAERLGCSLTRVRGRMKRYNIKARPPGGVLRNLVPEEVLLQWTPELAYVVGLVTADGNLVKGDNGVVFSSTDRELIETYQRCLGVSLHVYTQHRVGCLPYHQIGLSDPAYRTFLEDVGLTPAKSRTLGTLKIPDEFFRDFLRGCIDGDGDIGLYTDKRRPYSRRLVVGLSSASRLFLVWIHDTIVRLATVEGAMRRKQTAFFRLVYTDSKACQLLSWLYFSRGLPCLERKRAVWIGYVDEGLARLRAAKMAASGEGRWHAVGGGRPLCGQGDAARWRPVLAAPEDCLHDERLCRRCRKALANLLELDRYASRLALARG